MFKQERFLRAKTKTGELLWMHNAQAEILTRQELALLAFQKWELRKYLGSTDRQEMNENGH